MYLQSHENGVGAWDGSRVMPEQQAWDKHADFMNDLVSTGFVILGGPLEDSARILLVVEAESKEAVPMRLDADPWTRMDLLQIAAVERWEIVLGDLAKGTISTLI